MIKTTKISVIGAGHAGIEAALASARMGIDTVLTSGGAPSCSLGLERIKRLVALRDELNGPEILVGAGVNAAVITRFRQECPSLRAFHMSGKMELESGMKFRREGVPMGLPGLDEWHIQQTNPSAGRAARVALDA